LILLLLTYLSVFFSAYYGGTDTYLDALD